MGYTFTWKDIEKICRKQAWKDKVKVLSGRVLVQTAK